ncbi:hypothetical protein [Sphingomonas aquatilis]|uniref:UrcA family protein n=1 Tax=Sphingomonas aquatilis TaxID=93063 RepID=A0AAW3TM62_9SPHN|nr:hypothetical protein [Sphingomonas aquatilis]MBB3874042.1 hypothetical protein [Sphingomonas aquatilis]MCI4654582.1 hypothetical protein [Sphingomonas aquatilis]GEM71678.1 hypothetical protein SAQ01S_14440 [Sphingomonas aquatilis NBRC 16722]
MIALALLLAVTPVAEPPGEDIVVTGRRRAARRLRIVTKTDRRTGDIRCVFKRRSGDAALDAGMCAGLLACAPMSWTSAEVTACMTPVWKRLIGGEAAPAG